MSTDLTVIEAALKAATPGPWEASADTDNMVPDRAAILTAWCFEGEDAELVTDWCTLPDAHLIANAPAWLAELVERVKVAEAEVVSAKADGWDERDRAQASYLGPDNGHYKGCMGYEDCYCGTYPNPYRALDGDA